MALQVPEFDAPRLPVMQTLNEVLGSVKMPIPPLRNIEGVLAHMRKIAVPDTHAFRGKKDEEPPAQWLLTPMTELEAAELIERHIDFYEENAKTGTRRSVSLPMIFVQHYLQRFDGVLPTAVVIATLPIVLPDGELLAPDGLDRERWGPEMVVGAMHAALRRRLLVLLDSHAFLLCFVAVRSVSTDVQSFGFPAE